MKYVFVQDSIVGAVIPDKDPVFPGIPISKRYSTEFLSRCVAVKNSVEVQTGWLYQDGVFTEPVAEEVEGPNEPVDPPAETEETP